MCVLVQQAKRRHRQLLPLPIHNNTPPNARTAFRRLCQGLMFCLDHGYTFAVNKCPFPSILFAASLHGQSSCLLSSALCPHDYFLSSRGPRHVMAGFTQSLLSPAAALLMLNKSRAEISNETWLRKGKNGESTTIKRKAPLLDGPSLCIFHSKDAGTFQKTLTSVPHSHDCTANNSDLSKSPNFSVQTSKSKHAGASTQHTAASDCLLHSFSPRGPAKIHYTLDLL